MSELSITLSLDSKDGPWITDRPEVISLLNDTMMRIDKDIGPLGSTKYLLESIKLEKPTASFRFEWKPKQQYKNIFLDLKTSKTEFKLFLKFIYKENGKATWILSAIADKATAKNVQKSGNTNNAFQTIDIECKNLTLNRLR